MNKGKIWHTDTNLYMILHTYTHTHIHIKKDTLNPTDATIETWLDTETSGEAKYTGIIRIHDHRDHSPTLAEKRLYPKVQGSQAT